MSNCLDVQPLSESQLNGEHVTSREALFNKHVEWAGRIARKVSNHLPPCFDVDDLQQEAQIELWRKASQYDPSGKHEGVPFQGFAYLAVRGAALMSVRRRHWRAATGDELHDKHVDPQPRPDEAAEQAAFKHADDQRQDWQLQWLQSAIVGLPPEQREVMCGIYFEDADPDELAARMGLTSSELSGRRREALKQLRKMRPSEPVFSAATARRRQLQAPNCRPVRPPLSRPVTPETAP
ncbi:MAG: sigma-70 family RNA polymerase sigma factor [Bryobacteraceae bacterium]